ncbi:MAG: glycosyltransferase family 4 protein, partial [Dethiobacteria bacterium]
TVHTPLDIRIFQKEAKALVQEGYDVSLIAQHERDEIVGGVKIIAIPKSKNRFTRFFGLTWKAFYNAFRQKADVYHFHDPELIPCGVLLKILNKGRVVYDVHEDLPKQIFNKYWIPGGLRKLVAWCSQLAEAIGAFFFDRIVAATPKIAERFPTGKTVVVQNYPRLDELVMENTIPYKQRPPYVVYVGGISRARGIEEMVEAVGLLPEKLKVRLVLAGSFSPAALEKELKQRPEWRQVDFWGWQSREGIKKILSEARIGLVILHPTPNYLDSYPTKMFEYMSTGIPVVASDFPLWRKIVEKTGCGLLVDPLKPEEIAQAIQWLLENPDEAQAMGERGREAVHSQYNWSIEEKKLLQMYKELL